MFVVVRNNPVKTDGATTEESGVMGDFQHNLVGYFRGIYGARSVLYSTSSRMDQYTQLFWLFTLLFVGLSAYLVCCTKRSNVFYLQIASGLGIFATSKIGRKFLGLA